MAFWKERDTFRSIHSFNQKNTTTLCIMESKIELGKEGIYISYNNRGKFGGLIDAAG